MAFSLKLTSECNICGSTRFSPAPNNRLAFGRSPKCNECGAMERHRSLRQFYESVGAGYFSESLCIQFSADSAAPHEWFKA